MVSQKTVKEGVSFLPSSSPVLILLVYHDSWLIHSGADGKIQCQVHLSLKETPYKKRASIFQNEISRFFNDGLGVQQ